MPPARFLPCGLAVALACGLAACDDPKPAAPQAGPPPAVFVAKASLQPITQGAEFVGRVEALERVDIRARVTGFLRERTFVEGQLVKAEEMLFELEREPFIAEVAQQQAAVERAKAQANNAALQVNRGRELVKSNTLAQATQDQRIADQLTASANVEFAQAELAKAKIQLGYTRILSPIDGRVGRATFTRGNVVGPDSGVLTTVVRQDKMRVVFPVSQRQLLAWRKTQPNESLDTVVAKLRLADGALYEQTGKLNFVDVKTDRSTDSVLIQAEFPNPKAMLSDGQFVVALIEAEAPKQGLLIPESAVQVDQAGAFVLVVGEGNKVEARRVKLSRGPAGQQVVDDGLREGEMVITEGGQRARPGAVVAPRPAAAPLPGRAG